MAPTLSMVDTQVALVHDHIHDRHATRAHAGCPVCRHALPEWRRRALERVELAGNTPAWVTRGGAA